MEQWKTHPTTGLQVSTEGRVITRNKGKQRGCSYKGGYLMIRRGGKAWKVHRMIAEAFIPNPESKPQVNHKNGDKQDNRVENLEWATPSENTKHAYDTGLRHKGEDHGRNKLSNESVLEIRQNIHGLTQKALGELYGVSRCTIMSIIHRKTWQHI